MNLNQKITINKFAWKRDIFLILVATYFIPMYLLFHWDKVVIERFLGILIVCTIAAFFWVRSRLNFLNDFSKIERLILCDGKIALTHQISVRPTRYQAEVVVHYDGKSYRFLSRKIGYPPGIGSLVQVLFDSQDPRKSIVIEHHPYLRSSKIY